MTLNACGGGGSSDDSTAPTTTYTVDTFAGSRANFMGVTCPCVGHDGVGRDATFYLPSGMAFDKAGNLYVTDGAFNNVRKITPGASVTTLAGGGPGIGGIDGAGTVATFQAPRGVTVAANGDVFVADQNDNTIRRITPDGTVSTFAGNGDFANVNGPALQASFTRPESLVFNSKGELIVTDYSAMIKKIGLDGQVTTFVGAQYVGEYDGTGTDARLEPNPSVVIDANDNLWFMMYSPSHGYSVLRKVTSEGKVTTITPKGSGADSDGTPIVPLPANAAIAIAPDGGFYIGGTQGSIRHITQQGAVTPVAGAGGAIGYVDGPGAQARFNNFTYLATGPDGRLYVSDTANGTIRVVTAHTP